MSTKLQSISPIDGQVMWSGDAATAEEVAVAMRAASDAHQAWSRTPIDRRAEIVRAYGRELQAHREELAQLISREVGKLGWDANGEVSAAIAKAELSIQAIEQRRSTEVISDAQESATVGPDLIRITHRVRHQPLGVILVLGPFNFPLHLPGGQIIPALLAGNTVVFKPSDQATAVAQWMHAAWQRAGLPGGVMQLIPGGVETASAAIDSPLVSGVFLTGGREAGRAIHRRLAGRYEVSLALELGGNNPIVVTEEVAPDEVGPLVSFAAFVSSGQRCTCARRAIFVEGVATDNQIGALVRCTSELRVGMPGSVPPPHIGPLISQVAGARVKETYQRLLLLGCVPVVPFQVEVASANLICPAILDASSLDATATGAMGELEWFGPLLVIQRVKSFEEAIRAAAQTPYGLAASLLGGSREMFELFVRDVRAGVVNWNGSTTGAAGLMPFGGLGDSGNHRPVGFYAVDACCDPVASIERDSLGAKDPWAATQ